MQFYFFKFISVSWLQLKVACPWAIFLNILYYNYLKCFLKVVPGSEVINLFQFNTGVVKTNTIKLVLPHEQPHNRNICGCFGKHSNFPLLPVLAYVALFNQLLYCISFYFLIINTIGILQRRKYLWCTYFSRKFLLQKSTFFHIYLLLCFTWITSK